jgi:hypothetical protein
MDGATDVTSAVGKSFGYVGEQARLLPYAFASKADMCGATKDVRYRPKADIASCDNLIGDPLKMHRHVEAQRLRSLRLITADILSAPAPACRPASRP